MRILWGIALLCVLPILLCNTVLYAWRTTVLRRAMLTEMPERLGSLNSVEA